MKRERFMMPVVAIALMLAGCNVGKKQQGEAPSSIDEELQMQTDSLLRAKMTELDATQGQIIVMETKTGWVRAMVTLERKDSALTECKEFPAQESGLIKPAVLLAAMETGKVSLYDSVDTGDGVLAINDSITIKDHNWYRDGYGVISLTEGLMKSSNIATYLTAKKAFENDKAMCEALHKVGYEADFREEELSPFTCLGYDQSITPLQTLTFFNAIAYGAAYGDEMIKPLFKEEDAVSIKQIASSYNNIVMMNSLDSVVHYGLGKKAICEFFPIAGATGTVQLKPKEGEETPVYAVQFCGFFPSAEAEYSVIVTMNKPGNPASGGEMAAYVCKEIADYLAIHRGVGKNYYRCSCVIEYENI